jgi:hypothetical protein
VKSSAIDEKDLRIKLFNLGKEQKRNQNNTAISMKVGRKKTIELEEITDKKGQLWDTP